MQKLIFILVIILSVSAHKHKKHGRRKTILHPQEPRTVNAVQRSSVKKMGWDDLCTRAQFLPVSYPYNDIKSCMDTFPLESLAERPKVELQKLGKLTEKNLTLVMVDPDAPSAKNPSCRSWLHWIVSNVNTKTEDIRTGREIVKYQPPSPPSGSGKHRYYFLLYEQNDKTVYIKDPDDRCRFDVDAFSTENDLDGPIAISLVRTERP